MGKPRSQSFKIGQDGSVIIFVAVSLLMLLSFAALSIDTGHLFVATAELQNAADAGALAGARFLNNENPPYDVNTGANLIAYNAAIANKSEKFPVEVLNWDDADQNGDVQRGHYSFATKTFTPNPSTVPVPLWGVTTEELDADTNFINAVRVVTRRKVTKVASYLAGLFGFNDGFEMSAEAIAYIGFAGSLEPGEVDFPIAICQDSITVIDTGSGENEYTCSVGRMITQGSADETSAWTNYEQPEPPCGGAANDNSVSSLIDGASCAGSNPGMITFGAEMQTNNGQLQDVYKDFWDCWWTNSNEGTKPWKLTLMVIDCGEGGKVDGCEEVIGAVTVNIIWVNDKANKSQMNDEPSNDPSDRPGGAPTSMTIGEPGDDNYKAWGHAGDIPGCTDCYSDSGLPGTPGAGAARWQSFVNAFNLDLGEVETPVDGWYQKTIYYVPDCSPHEPTGLTGEKILESEPKFRYWSDSKTQGTLLFLGS